MIQLSMIDANDFVQSVILGGNPYKLHYSWNSYAGQWTVDVRTPQNEDIVRGIAIVPNYPLFTQGRRNGLSRGELMAIVVKPEEKGNQTISRRGFVDGKFSMVYVPEGEVNAIIRATEQ